MISEIICDILTCTDFKIVATLLFGDTLFDHSEVSVKEELS